jgi:hypothetical protein
VNAHLPLELGIADQRQRRDVVHSDDYLYIPATVFHVATNDGRRRFAVGESTVGVVTGARAKGRRMPIYRRHIRATIV